MPSYIAKNNQQIGPLEDTEIETGLRDGTYSPDDLMWRDGMANWAPLRDLNPSASVPPPLPPQGHPVRGPRAGDDLGMRLLLPVGRSGWAIAAGYLGLFSLIILPAPIALVVSVIAIRDIRKSKASGPPKYGMGRAIFGLVMGILGTGLIVALLIAR